MNVVCVGDCGIDRYVNLGLDRPGGIVLNFAVNARRLFRPDDRVIVLTALGDDVESATVLGVIEHFGIEGAVTRCPGRTPVQQIERLPSGERRFVGYDEGVLATYRMGSAERAVLHTADVLMAPVFAQNVDLFDSVMASPSPGLRAVDFSDMADFGSSVDIVDRWIESFHIGFFGLTPADEPLIDGLERLAARHHKVFAVTLGAVGSLALGSFERIARPACPVEQVVDTTGAGDTFAAAFLAEYSRSRDVGQALECGNREAAWSVQRFGAF